MRHVLSLRLAVSLALAGSFTVAGAASASITIDQPFTSQPADWTPITSNGGTISFANSNLDVTGYQPTDTSQSGNAYETTTPVTTIAYTTAGGVSTGTLISNFDVTFNLVNTSGDIRSSDSGTVYAVNGGGNNPLGALFLSVNGYFNAPKYELRLGNGIYYGGAHTVGTPVNDYLVDGSAIDGQTYHVTMTTTVTDNGPDLANPGYNNWTISDVMSVSNGTNTYPFSQTVNGDADSGGYNPLNNPTTFQLGNIGFGVGLYDPTFELSGDSAFSNFTVTNPVPEPATLGLISVGLLAGFFRRRRSLNA